MFSRWKVVCLQRDRSEYFCYYILHTLSIIHILFLIQFPLDRSCFSLSSVLISSLLLGDFLVLIHFVFNLARFFLFILRF